MSQPTTAWVTAGGTSEPVDDVRVLTNLSTGRFGCAIAAALAEQGVQTTLFLAERSTAPVPQGVTVIRFGSADDLDAKLSQSPSPDLLFMAAAVSDYRPERVEGKIRSHADELILRLVRNKKILPTLSTRHPQTQVIGFKLLSRVSTDELLDTARGQIASCGTAACVANDLQELGGGEHPCWLVRPGEQPLRLEGAREDVARDMVSALRRTSL